MKTNNEQTTMICLFHAREQADAAIKDLVDLGIPRDSIGVMANAGTAAANPAALEKWKVPERDARLLTDGINKGGVVVAVSAAPAVATRIEAIFDDHKASKIDETVAGSTPTQALANGTTGAPEGTLDVIEEEMTVGKREVQRGGVRVYQRVVETPVSEAINLREEHVTIERRPVNRPVTAADASAFQDRSFEITETSEEAVVAKTARVVEEIVVGKDVSERTETVKGTVRKTEIDVEEIEPDTRTKTSGSRQ